MMQIAGYSDTWGPITQTLEVNYCDLFQWYRDLNIRAIEPYGPWIKGQGDDHVEIILDALGKLQCSPACAMCTAGSCTAMPMCAKAQRKHFKTACACCTQTAFPSF